ncbi:MAG: electron transfer flavoprotein subunit beta/FixA family protein [Clostridiales bacterium]|nr:electron transfer flavoprotein subunit beta/FixA family protein [Clostridiales bacterium]
MNIVIPIKQVPETSNVKMDPETGTMIRDGVESIINPLDLYAIETGIQLKEQYGGKVTVVSMGPPSAAKALKEAISMGCDDGILVSDRKFAGADTWSTAYVLVKAIEKIQDVDLVIAGERATDGDTGQVGPNIASAMNLPLATYVSKINEIKDNEIIVERLTEEGYEKLQIQLPALLTVVKEISYPRLPTLRGKQRARKMELPVYSVQDLDVEESKLGLNGSPTRVVKIETPKVTRGGKIIKVNDDESLNNAVDELINFLKVKEVI